MERSSGRTVHLDGQWRQGETRAILSTGILTEPGHRKVPQDS